MIKLAHKYMELVKQGIKTQTIRFGTRDYALGPSVLQDTSTGEVLPIEIVGVLVTTFDRLSTLEAVRDGFENLDQLYAALQEFYLEIQPDSWVTRVRFEMREGDQVSSETDARTTQGGVK